MGNFLIAWLVGLSLHIAQGATEWKYTTGTGMFPLTFASPLPPKPGQLLVASGIYIGLAILAESTALRGTAILTAWGYNIAIGLTWAQNYQSEKGTQKKSNGSWFWTPPIANGSNLFPTGSMNGVNAAPSSQNTSTPGAPSGGTQVA